MILPPRPLQLRRAYLRDVRARMLAVALGAVLTLILFGQIVVGALGLVGEDRIIAAGIEVPIRQCYVRPLPHFGPFATFEVIVEITEGGTTRFQQADFLVPFTADAPTTTTGARAYRDPDGDRVVTTLEHGVRGPRAIAIALLLVGFGSMFVVLALALVGRVREHVAVARAARASDELLVEVDREESGTIDYQVTARVVAHEGGYRTPATPKRWLARHRQRRDERAPMVLSGPKGRRLVVLRSEGASASVVVRDDYWPFVVDGDARLRADERAKIVADGGLVAPEWP